MRSLIDTRRHVLGLDIVRFWAACAVALYHLAFWSWASTIDLPYRVSGGSVRFEGLEPFTWFGWSGVETFFVISGFVICASAEHATPYRFLRSRIARLYPAVGICATITAVVLLGLHLSTPTQLAADYLRSLLIFSKGPWVDTVYKTLIVEGVFYALVLALLMAGWFRRIERIALMLGAYSLAFWIFSMFVHPIVRPGVTLYFSKNAIFFALGMMIWVTKQHGPSLSRVAILGLFTCCGALEVHFVSVEVASIALHVHAIVAVLVWLASVAAIMGSVFFNERLPRAVHDRADIFRAIGLMTYPLYLIHDVVGSAVLRTSSIFGQTAALWLALLVSFVGACVVVRIEPFLRRPLVAGLDTIADAFQHRKWNLSLQRAS